MKNTLVDLQNHLFEMIETLNNSELKGDNLEEEIKRSIAINELVRTAVTNGALMVKAADCLYGLPVYDSLPLIPASPSDQPKLLDGKRRRLIDIPKAGNHA